MPAPPPARSALLSTPARLSLGTASPTVSTRDHLAFQLDHALARDAVSAPLDVPCLERELRARNLTPLHLRSAAPDRAAYLRRPDLGRSLHPDSVETLSCFAAETLASFAAGGGSASRPTPPLLPPDTLFLLADGLSALAVERHALSLLDAVLSLLHFPCPLVPLLTNARVAIADHVGSLLGARMTVLLIGERPGLSSPDSLGCYLTWNPTPGRTDAERNCISNIRGDAGLSYGEAGRRIAHYIAEAHRLQLTGTTLKDPSSGKLAEAPDAPGDGAQAASATGTSMRRAPGDSASETVLRRES